MNNRFFFWFILSFSAIVFIGVIFLLIPKHDSKRHALKFVMPGTFHAARGKVPYNSWIYHRSMTKGIDNPSTIPVEVVISDSTALPLKQLPVPPSISGSFPNTQLGDRIGVARFLFDAPNDGSFVIAVKGPK